MFYSVLNHRDFDRWLTELPDEDLQHFCSAIDPLAENQVVAQETTTYLLFLILHFYGPHALSTEEMTDILHYFGINLAMETLWRKGYVTKQGKYSIVPDEDGALFTVAD